MSHVGCKHQLLKSYRGYVNLHWCTDCGMRFRVEPRLDKKIE